MNLNKQLARHQIKLIQADNADDLTEQFLIEAEADKMALRINQFAQENGAETFRVPLAASI